MTSPVSADDLVKALSLLPHPEGGHYREIARSDQRLPKMTLDSGYGEDRSLYTSIYYLLQQGEVSRIHRLKSDELWCLLAGGPLTLHLLEPGVGYRPLVLGSTPENEMRLQVVIERGVWFGATVKEQAPFALASCTVVPGFEFQDFELGDRDQLLAAFPAQHTIIERLTRV